MPPRGFLTGLYPLDGERAVVLMRANYSNDPDRFWLGVIRADDELLWSEELPASTYAVYSGHGLTVDAKRIGVHVTDRKTFTQQLGYQFKTGTPLWQTKKTKLTPKPTSLRAPVVSGSRPVVLEDSLLTCEADGTQERMFLRSAENGRTIWTLKLGKKGTTIQRIESTKRWILYRTDFSWHIVNRATGALAFTAKIMADACIDDERFVAWRGQTLVTIDLTREKLSMVERSAPGDTYLSARTCGWRGEQLVFYGRQRNARAESEKYEIIALTKSLACIAHKYRCASPQPLV